MRIKTKFRLSVECLELSQELSPRQWQEVSVLCHTSTVTFCMLNNSKNPMLSEIIKLFTWDSCMACVFWLKQCATKSDTSGHCLASPEHAMMSSQAVYLGSYHSKWRKDRFLQQQIIPLFFFPLVHEQLIPLLFFPMYSIHSIIHLPLIGW